MASCCLLKHEKLNAQYVQLSSAIVWGETQIKTIVLFRGNFPVTARVRVGAQRPQRGEQLEQGGVKTRFKKGPSSLSKNGSRKLASVLGELKNLPPEESITSIISP